MTLLMTHGEACGTEIASSVSVFVLRSLAGAEPSCSQLLMLESFVLGLCPLLHL